MIYLDEAQKDQKEGREEAELREEEERLAAERRMNMLKDRMANKIGRRWRVVQAKIDRKRAEPAAPAVLAVPEELKPLPELPFLDYDYSKKECPICMSDSCINDTLSCGHSYCSSCIKLLLKDLIDNGKVFPDELLCPLCQQTIPDSDIQRLIGWQYDRLLQLRAKFKRDKLVSLGQAKHCPLPNCAGFVHIINGQLSNACSICKVTICPDCMKCSHPTLSCEEYALVHGSQEKEINELLLSRSWKRCAFCSTLVEKVDGCNFVKCNSNVCRNSDHAICYLCGKALNEKHHHNHYQVSGPFGHTCNTMDGIEDVPLNE